MADNAIQISLDTNEILEITAATAALKGLSKALTSVAEGVQDAFTITGYRDYLQTVSRFGKRLTDQLLTMQMSFGRLKVAIAQAFAPIAQVVVPYINQAINAIIRFAGVVRQFLSALFAGTAGTGALAEAAGDAADAENTLKTAATSAGKAAKRSLMGLDQLERLNAPTGGGGGSSYSYGSAQDTISPQVQAMVARIRAFLEPLLTIDLTPLKTALQGLWESVCNLAAVLQEALRWLWEDVLVPFTAWLLEALAPALTGGFAGALDMVTAAIAPLLAGIQGLWEGLKPVVEYIGTVVVGAIELMRGAFARLTQTFIECCPQLTGVFQNVGKVITGVWSIIGPIFTAIGTVLSGAFNVAVDAVSVGVRLILNALYNLTGFLAGAFTISWRNVWGGIGDFFKGIVNGIVDLLNAMLQRLTSALNAVVNAANRLSFTVPSWVPGVGGKTFGFNMSNVSTPSIPYLAQGAVLPANKPFLAMVGDQRHGTNIEAPLATIETAVANVMQEQTGAILAGFEASVGVQKEILEAVLGIRIGDEVIGRAMSRYNRRQAVMRGGAL